LNSYILYIITAVLLLISFKKDKKKTKMALKKGWKSMMNIVPQLLGILMLVGLVFSVFNAETISKVLGEDSGWMGVVVSAVVGSITLIPGFVAFPTAAMVLQNGAGYMQIAAFVSSLMMVGVMTASLEMEYFGKKMTIIRNVFGFLFSFVVAFVIGRVLG
jgi:uncharacterized membrane protein YraQ (UPF0718 family)